MRGKMSKVLTGIGLLLLTLGLSAGVVGAHLASPGVARLAAGDQRARLTEAQGQQIVAVVRGALLELGADPGEPAVQQTVLRQLSAMGAGA